MIQQANSKDTLFFSAGRNWSAAYLSGEINMRQGAQYQGEGSPCAIVAFAGLGAVQEPLCKLEIRASIFCRPSGQRPCGLSVCHQESRDEGMKGTLAWARFIRVAVFQREATCAIPHVDSRARSDNPRTETIVVGQDG